MRKKRVIDRDNEMRLISESTLFDGTITKQFVVLECARIYEYLLNTGHSFIHKPRLFEVCDLPSSPKRSVLGCVNTAHHYHAVLSISSLFIGTKFFDALSYVVLHEMAHMMVGVHEKHGKKFRQFEAYLLERFGIDKTAYVKQAIQLTRLTNRKWKYKIFVISEDGDRLFWKYANAKNIRYTGYSGEKGWFHCNSLIVRFEYEANIGCSGVLFFDAMDQRN
jgi:hypothetical protein